MPALLNLTWPNSHGPRPVHSTPASEAKYTIDLLCIGFTMEMAWAIGEIKGEAAAEEGRFPDGPSPVWGPESVVCGQLQALRYAP